MKSLFYIYFTQQKAKIRNVFSKPVSAIFTLIAIGVMLFAFIGMTVLSKDENLSAVMSLVNVNQVITLYVAIILGLVLLSGGQKRLVLLHNPDASYLFTAPYTRKQIMTYIIFDNLMGSFVLTLGIVFYLSMFMGGAQLPWSLIFWMLLGGGVTVYSALMILIYVYLQSIVNPKYRKIRKAFVFLTLIVVGILLLIYMGQYNYDFQKGYQALANSQTINFIPIFGWLKLSLESFYTHNYLFALLTLAINGLIGVIITYFFVNYEGSFVEQALDDAEWYRKVMRGAKEGKTAVNTDAKIKTIDKNSFKEGSRAISSKIILEMRKANDFFSIKSYLLHLLYLVIVYFMGTGFHFYKYYILIILLSTISTEAIMPEFKKIYIYLIPEKPLKKLINVILPVLLKAFVTIVISLSVGGLVLQASVLEVLLSIVENVGYALLFASATVWSIKILKSRTNVVAEQFLKFLIILVASLPSIIITVVLAINGTDLTETLTITSIVSLIVNIVMGVLFLMLGKSILKGTNIMAD